ncbi:MAG: hypothetical protein QW096_09220 [Thermofilaceae archaeon]
MSSGINSKLSDYGISASLAVVIDGGIRIIGVCPSEETSKGALRGAGDNSIGRRYQADLARSAILLKVVPAVEVLTFHYFRAPL